tara:strand:- start:286 stop:537 length:252 start_codon:yes stop_codon:yes gene_type:complete
MAKDTPKKDETKDGADEKKKTRGNIGSSGSVSVQVRLSRSEFNQLNETWARVKGLGKWNNKAEFRAAMISSAVKDLNQKLTSF